MQRREFARLAGAIGLSGLAGCFGSGGGSNSGSTSTSTPTKTLGKGAQGQYPSWGWQRLEGKEPVTTNTIKIVQGQQFDPMIAKIHPDTKVRFVNEAGGFHNIVIPQLGYQETVGPRHTIKFKIGRTGKFGFLCTKHPPKPVGRLIVTEDAPTPEQTATTTSN